MPTPWSRASTVRSRAALRTGIRLRGLVLVACVAGVAAACTPTAPTTATPASPATASALFASVVYDANTTGNWELYRRDSATGVVTRLTNDAQYDSWWGKVSPDQTRVLFYRTPAGVHDTDYTKTSLWMMNIDGSNAHQVIATGANGWKIQGHAEWSPDGTKLAMFAYPGGVMITDANGQSPKHIVNGADPSWTSDGRVVYTNCLDPSGWGCTADQIRVWVVNADGTSPHLVVSNTPAVADPVMSPDGTKVAWESLGGGMSVDLWVANTDGTNPHKLFSDGYINTVPRWVSNNELVFVKNLPIALGFGIWTINLDGTGLTRIVGGEYQNFADFPFPLH
jgi:Tol biopolymer transport system component